MSENMDENINKNISENISKNKYKWLDESITCYSNYNTKYEKEIICHMRDYPENIKEKLDELYGGIIKGIELCQNIQENCELYMLNPRNAEWLEERLEKALSVLVGLVYKNPESEVWKLERK